jgi:hypothetical protein
MGAQKRRLAAGGSPAIVAAGRTAGPISNPSLPRSLIGEKIKMPKFKEGDRIMVEALIVAAGRDGYAIRIIDALDIDVLLVGLGIEESAVLKPEPPRPQAGTHPVGVSTKTGDTR